MDTFVVKDSGEPGSFSCWKTLGKDPWRPRIRLILP